VSTPGCRTVVVEIARTDPQSEGRFTVDVEDPAVVLDLLLLAQRQEPGLAFTYSCRVGMCGTCAVRINGRAALACSTRVQTTERTIRIDPLAGFPVVRDVVVDTTPFWRAWRRVQPWFVARGDGGDRIVLAEGDPSRRLVEDGLDCIACGACWSACDLTGHDPGFVGPAALTRAMTLVADTRDGARTERLRAVSQAQGIAGCHYIHGCAAACPKHIDTAGAIRRLRRWRVGARR
jgi:succinate dehydrogenase / fumarate reductase iron-sulfur subunit/fumarate reductase iron-sulfur subunit